MLFKTIQSGVVSNRKSSQRKVENSNGSNLNLKQEKRKELIRSQILKLQNDFNIYLSSTAKTGFQTPLITAKIEHDTAFETFSVGCFQILSVISKMEYDISSKLSA